MHDSLLKWNKRDTHGLFVLVLLLVLLINFAWLKKCLSSKEFSFAEVLRGLSNFLLKSIEWNTELN